MQQFRRLRNWTFVASAAILTQSGACVPTDEQLVATLETAVKSLFNGVFNVFIGNFFTNAF